MAYTTCTNPTCKYPGEKYEEYGMQKWCPRCSWPISARCPNYVCERELTKEIVKNGQCTCGEKLAVHYSIFHFSGLFVVTGDKTFVDIGEHFVEYAFRPPVHTPLIIPEKEEVFLFWKRNALEVRQIVFPIISELGLFPKDNVVQLSDYLLKKGT